eukprot:Tbor_TRINITY_DN5827_c3_g2::TRINITY_DN5827_c3_g2_i1::g.6452::m.6452
MNVESTTVPPPQLPKQEILDDNENTISNFPKKFVSLGEDSIAGMTASCHSYKSNDSILKLPGRRPCEMDDTKGESFLSLAADSFSYAPDTPPNDSILKLPGRRPCEMDDTKGESFLSLAADSFSYAPDTPPNDSILKLPDQKPNESEGTNGENFLSLAADFVPFR